MRPLQRVSSRRAESVPSFAPTGRSVFFKFLLAARHPPFQMLSVSSRSRATTSHPARPAGLQSIIPPGRPFPLPSRVADRADSPRPSRTHPGLSLQALHFRPRRRTSPGRHPAPAARVPPAQPLHWSRQAPSPDRPGSARAAAALVPAGTEPRPPGFRPRSRRTCPGGHGFPIA